MSLGQELNERARQLGMPLSAHLDLTYRCNERCVHCYLEHDDKGELTTVEIMRLLEEMSSAGVFYLVLSGGEPLLRRDLFDIIARARALLFNVKLKTNAVMIGSSEARRLRLLGVEQVQVSVYSHRSEVHDAITKLPGSLRRTLQGVRKMKEAGLRVSLANVLMRANAADVVAVKRLAEEIGVQYTLDPTITPMIDGNTTVLSERADADALRQAFRTPELVDDSDEYCAPPPSLVPDDLDAIPCSAGHTSCYISPYGDFYPCVQFPVACGNIRRQRFADIWGNSPQLEEIRTIRLRDLATCSGCAHGASCTRCPGLAFMEGDMRGPSTADCEKSYLRTGVPTANMLNRAAAGHRAPFADLVQIQLSSR